MVRLVEAVDATVEDSCVVGGSAALALIWLAGDDNSDDDDNANGVKVLVMGVGAAGTDDVEGTSQSMFGGTRKDCVGKPNGRFSLWLWLWLVLLLVVLVRCLHSLDRSTDTLNHP